MTRIISKTSEYVNLVCKVFQLLWESSAKYTVLIIGINFLIGIIPPISSVVWMQLLNATIEAINSKEFGVTLNYLYLYAFLAIIAYALRQIAGYCDGILSSYVNRHIMNITMKKVARMSMHQFDDSELYNKIEKVNNESTVRSMGLLRTITNMVSSTSTLISVMAILWQLNLTIIFASLIICIPSLLMSMKIALKQFHIFNERFEKIRWLDYLKKLVVEYENVKEIKVNNINEYVRNTALDEYGKYIKEDKQIRRRFVVHRIVLNFGEEHVNFFIKLFILIQVILAEKTVGEFSLYISSMDNLRNAISIILNTIASIFEDGLYIQNLFEILNEKEEVENAAQDFNGDFTKIEFKDVWFKYPGSSEYILQGINLCMDNKKSYSFVGLNGSGKTTMLKLLLKLYTPDRGNIYIDGSDLRNIKSDEYYKKIGVIFQDFIKYPMTIGENIGVGDIENVNDINRIKSAAHKSEANQFIEKFPQGYDTKLLREWSGAQQLSLGQWQKIAISRAFMKESSILILDEPTASLDAEAEFEIYKKFKVLMAGKLCIFISHRLTTVQLVDCIYVLKDGRIIEQGNHNELINQKGEYERLYMMQAEAYKENNK